MNKEHTITIEAKKVDFNFTCMIKGEEYSDHGSVIISEKYTKELSQDRVTEEVHKKILSYINSKNIEPTEGMSLSIDVNVTNVSNIGTNIRLQFK